MAGSPPSRRRFAALAWAVLGYTVAVILWGAYVRASGSGNGCGDNWPLCDGQWLPAHPQLKMLIEFAHRASSGVDGILIAILGLAAWRLYPSRHRVRRGAMAAVILVITEALLGAALVLFGWTGLNSSVARVAADAVHLTNTLLLAAALALTAAWTSGLGAARWQQTGRERWLPLAGLIGIVLTGAFGVTAALADTLYPATSLASGMHTDFSTAASWLQRIRIVHPAVAIAAGLYLLYMLTDGLQPASTRLAQRLGYGVAAAVLLQWTLGLIDLTTLTPAWLQMLHLLGADLLWLLLVLYTAARWEAAASGTLGLRPTAPDGRSPAAASGGLGV